MPANARVVLVPYEKRHVAKYHEWMLDPWLREMTASEPLTLAEEYEMQVSWALDDAKCTFIVCAAAEAKVDGVGGEGDASGSEGGAFSVPTARMIGDVNLFLSQVDVDEYDRVEDEDDDGVIDWGPPPPPPTPTLLQAEIDVMIAAPAARRRGNARAAVLLMVRYGVRTLGVQRVVAKILVANEASLALFTKIGFVERRRVEGYGEVHLVLEGIALARAVASAAIA